MRRRGHPRAALALQLSLILAAAAVGCRSTDPASPRADKSIRAPAVTGGAAVGRSAPGPGVARAGRWRPAGFYGAGNFLSVRADPRRAGVFYAASDTTGVFRSEDGGEHWQLRAAGLGNYEIPSLAVDPFDSNTVYAAVGAFPKARKAGLYVSHDAGLSWRHLSATFSQGITFRKYRNVASIAPDPARARTLLAGSAHNGLWRSTDGGQRWERVLAAPPTRAPLDMPDEQAETPTPYGAPVSMVVFDPAAAGRVYAALYGAGVYRSTASGKAGSWKLASAGLPAQATVKFLAPAKGVLWAAVARAGVFRSDDGGDRWVPASGDLPLKRGWITAVAAVPGRKASALAVLASHDAPSVWRTDDGGKRWVAQKQVAYDRQANPTRQWANDPTLSWWISIDPHDPRRLFFTDYWGIQRSDDGGETWADKVRGAQNTCVTSLTLDQDHPAGRPDTLYATHMDAGLLASVDGGRSWRPLVPKVWSESLAGHYWKLAIVKSDGGARSLFATMDPWDQQVGRVLRSDDGGETWRPVFASKRPKGEWLSGFMIGLAADPSAPGTLYVTQDGGAVHVTRDGGKTWRPTAGQPADRSFTHALAVDAAGRVFAGTLNGGLFRSTDRGKRWERVLEEQATIWKVLAAGGALYASSGSDANLHRSEDGGKTWRRLTSFARPDPGDETGDQGMGIAVDPADARHLLFSRVDTSHSADQSAGVVESLDGGKTWRQANDNLAMTSVNVLTFGRGKTVWAGTWGAGIWRRD